MAIPPLFWNTICIKPQTRLVHTTRPGKHVQKTNWKDPA